MLLNFQHSTDLLSMKHSYGSLLLQFTVYVRRTKVDKTSFSDHIILLMLVRRENIPLKRVPPGIYCSGYHYSLLCFQHSMQSFLFFSFHGCWELSLVQLFSLWGFVLIFKKEVTAGCLANWDTIQWNPQH